MSNVKVSVVVPVFNEESFIGACLEALQNQSVAADEIIVVDNNCTDKTIGIAKKFPVTVVKESVQGMIAARNKGFNSAKYSVIATVDADSRVTVDWIKNIKEIFTKRDNIVALTGDAWFYDLKSPKWLVISLYKFYDWVIRLFLKHPVLNGPNYAITRSVWQKVKEDVCLDKDNVFEDIDLSIHIGEYGNIIKSSKVNIAISSRRFRSLSFYYNYPKITFDTLNKHKKL